MDQNDDTASDGNTLAGLITIGIAIALFYFNGWRVDETAYLQDVTGLGLFADNYNGGPAVFVRIDQHWYGLSRTNLDALLFDAPLINMMALIASVPMLLTGIRAIIWPEPISSRTKDATNEQ